MQYYTSRQKFVEFLPAYFDNFFFHFYFLFPHALPYAAHIRQCTPFYADEQAADKKAAQYTMYCAADFI